MFWLAVREHNSLGLGIMIRCVSPAFRVQDVNVRGLRLTGEELVRWTVSGGGADVVLGSGPGRPVLCRLV
jgi:hypothetical protein